MGLLDNLFKPKPESDREKSVENSGTPDPAELHTPASKASPFLAPQQYVPRSSVQIVPPTRGQLQVEVKAAPGAGGAFAPKEIVLTLGDVLSRIPTQYLRPGMHDTQRELRFPADGFDADIARGRASVFLADIIAQCPDVFSPEAAAFDDTQIRLPLQKLVEQIALAPVLRPAPPAPFVPSAPLVPPAPEPASVKSAVEISTPVTEAAPVATVAPTSADEQQIYLSLAVILKRCPKEIIVQPLPAIDESVRIAFPFSPIERQLATGQVEVSSLRFIAALPLGLMKCFEAKAGIKVPLPLEEIFQNLPGQPPSAGFAARFPALPPEPEPFAEARELSAKNAKLAEAILLEPMDEMPEMPQAVVPSSAVPVENIISANFAAEPAIAPEPERDKPEFQAPPISIPEPEPAKIETPVPLEIKAEEPAWEPALSEEPKTAPEPPVEIVATAPSILPEPVAPPAPPAPPVEAAAFHRFVLPPPVLLRPKADFIEPAPMPAAPPPTPAPEIPQSPKASQPELEPAAPAALGESAPTPPPAEPVPEPIPAISAPAISERPAQNLHIAPPQFRPVFLRPPIVLSTLDVPPPVEPIAQPAIPAPVVNQEPVPETASPAATAQPEPPPPIPEPAIAFTEPVPSHTLDGRIPALFASDAPVSLARVSELLAALPGIKGCILTSPAAEAQAGELPAGLDAPAVRDISRRMHTALADRAGQVQHLTLQTEHDSFTLFTRGEACVCAIHRARIFLPGVRERFAAVAEELARAL